MASKKTPAADEIVEGDAVEKSGPESPQDRSGQGAAKGRGVNSARALLWVTGVLGVLGAGGYAYIHWQSGTRTHDSLQAEISALSQQLADQQTQIAALEAARSDGAAIQADFRDMVLAAVADQATEIARNRTDLEAASQRLDRAAASVRDRPEQGAVSGQSSVPLSTDEKYFLAQSLVVISNAMNAENQIGRPLLRWVPALDNLAARGVVPGQWERLRTALQKAPPSREELILAATDFIDPAGVVPDDDLADGSALARLGARLGRLVNLRPVGQNEEESDNQRALFAAALEGGKLDAAADHAADWQGPVPKGMAVWQDNVEARLTLDHLLAEMLIQAIDYMAASIPPVTEVGE